jgi:hypothetical protein
MRKFNAKNGGLRGDYKNVLVRVDEIYHSKGGHLDGTASIKVGTYEERVSPDASPTPQTGRNGTMRFALSPSSGNWVMYEMQLNE